MRKIWDFLKRIFGFATLAQECPLCHEIALRWHGDNPIHEEGPPIFEWWSCSACGAETEYGPSELSNRAARRLGYKDAKELLMKCAEKPSSGK